jgi:hypothetical protein
MNPISRFFILLIFIAFISCEDFNKFYNQSKELHLNNQKNYIARVGNKYVTSDELLAALNEVPFKQRILVQTSETSFKHFLESYINKELLYNKALELGFDKRVKVEKKVELYLKNLLIRNLTEELLNSKISEQQLIGYYESNINDYMYIKVIQISLYKSSDIKKDNLETIIKNIRAKLTNDGELDKINLFLSKIPNLKYKIKDNITIQKNNYDVKVTEILFELQPNQISNIINLDNSYNIYKIIEGPLTISYMNVKNQIKHDLRNTIYSEYLSQLRNTQGVEILIHDFKEISKHD